MTVPRWLIFCCLMLALCAGFAVEGRAAANPDMLQALAALEQRWAVISYQMPRNTQEAAFQTLSKQAEEIARQFPDEALPLAWRGIILCSWAEAQGGLQALGHVTQARDLFLQAKQIDPRAMNGTVDGYLGTLYYEVPGWPVSFGSKDKALAYFRQALATNPASIDLNFLYGHYLFETGDHVQAKKYLIEALSMPLRPDHIDYDNGRRQDIEETLAKMK